MRCCCSADRSSLRRAKATVAAAFTSSKRPRRSAASSSATVNRTMADVVGGCPSPRLEQPSARKVSSRLLAWWTEPQETAVGKDPSRIHVSHLRPNLSKAARRAASSAPSADSMSPHNGVRDGSILLGQLLLARGWRERTTTWPASSRKSTPTRSRSAVADV